MKLFFPVRGGYVCFICHEVTFDKIERYKCKESKYSYKTSSLSSLRQDCWSSFHVERPGKNCLLELGFEWRGRNSEGIGQELQI